MNYNDKNPNKHFSPMFMGAYLHMLGMVKVTCLILLIYYL